MNRRMRTMIIGFLAACVLSVAAPVSSLVAYAATARIAFSDPSATVGQEFNVTVRITAQDGSLGASDVMLSYDPSLIEFVSGNNASGGAGSVRLVGTMDSSNTTEFSYTLKFKAVQAGNTTISVGNYEVYDVDTQAVNVTKVGSSAVKVKAPATYSSEAALSSLKVSPGQLSPAFSPDVTSYSVSVGGDVEKLAVSAVTKDGKAKVKVNGESGLKTGANTVVCKVTAEDGQTTKSYTITVNKSETAEVPAESAGEAAVTGEAVLGSQTADIDGVQYTIAASFDAAMLPEGYTVSSCTYGGTEVMCGSGNGLNLLYLQDAEGNGAFFIYVAETGALSPYVTIDVAAKSILVLPPDESVEIPDGFAETMIQLNGNYKVKGWVWETDTEQNYCVVYGMNENGEKGLYRYDITEKTFQRYFKDPALSSKYDDAAVEDLYNQYESLRKDYNLRFFVIVALIIVSLILFFMVINLLLRKREHAGEERMQREEAPTPVKRRAMEEENRNRRPQPDKPSAGAPSGRASGRPSGTAEGGRPAAPRGTDETRPRSGSAPERQPAGRREADPTGRNSSGRREADPYGRDGAGRRGGDPSDRPSSGRTRDPYAENPASGRSRDPYAERPVSVRSRDPYAESAAPGRNRDPYAENAAPGKNRGPYVENPSSGRKRDPYAESAALGRSRDPYEEKSSSVRGRDPYAEKPVPGRNRDPYTENAAPGRSRDPYAEKPIPGRNRDPYAENAAPGRSRDPYAEKPIPGRSHDSYAEKPVSGRRPADPYERPSSVRKNSDPYADRSEFIERERQRMRDAGMEEAIRQRELERAERARRTRERLERERLEDERRARAARRETAAGRSTLGDDDDFEFLDL